MANISVVVSAFNEEKNIKVCLESVQDFAKEIIVVDNSSTDKTSEYARKFTKKVYTQKNDPRKIDLQKNLGIQKASQEWILMLDADEQVPEELAQEITKKLSDNEQIAHLNGFWIPRKNIIFGKWIQNSIWWPDYQLRLFRNGKGFYKESTVHKPMEVSGETGKLENPLIHENYQTITQYIQRLDTIYTEREAARIIASGRTLMWVDAIRFPTQDFLKTFFLQKGYKDGLHGLVLSILQAFYAEVVFAKVWEHQKFNEEKFGLSSDNSGFLKKVVNEFKRTSLEFQYWVLSSLIDHENNPIKKTSLKLLRKRIQQKLK